MAFIQKNGPCGRLTGTGQEETTQALAANFS
jgi:hypothetical protein